MRFRNRKTGAGDVYIVNSKCHWCANKGGNHGHSNVYYVLSPRGCFQKCFCAKSFAGGPCDKYKSRTHRVPMETLEMLFSEVLLRKKRKEDRRLKMAQDVFSKVGSYAGGGEMPPGRSVDAEYGTPDPNIHLPVLQAGSLDRLRSRGIPKKLDYESIKAKITPRYSTLDFLSAIQDAPMKLV